MIEDISNNSDYNNTNKLIHFEKDITYEITIDINTYDSTKYKLGFKQVLNNTISIYNPTVLTEESTKITLRFNEETTGLKFYNQFNETDNSGSIYLSMGVLKPNAISYYIKVLANKYEVYFNKDSYGNYKYNGQLEWEDAFEYLKTRKTLKGAKGHSPLLGYAYDGFPIYGPLAYDKSKAEYYDNDQESSREVKFLKSSYTGSNDSNGNPQYVPNSGDLDFCNGIFCKTPEFPNGIYHYICTIQLDEDSNPKTVTDSFYGYRNVQKPRIMKNYHNIIDALKGNLLYT